MITIVVHEVVFVAPKLVADLLNYPADFVFGEIGAADLYALPENECDNMLKLIKLGTFCQLNSLAIKSNTLREFLLNNVFNNSTENIRKSLAANRCCAQPTYFLTIPRPFIM